MNIDSRNFNDQLPQIQQDIKNCDFLSFDLEFSGLFVEPVDQVSRFDSIEDQYQKCKHLSKNHHILQFGITTYRWDQQSKQYLAFSFSFYLAPPDGLQMFQSSSYKFLADQGFDFNRTIRYGLTYQQLFPKNKQKQASEIKQKYPSHYVESVLNIIVKNVKEFLDSKEQQTIQIECQNEEIANFFLNIQFQEKSFLGFGKFYAEKMKNRSSMLLLKKIKKLKLVESNELKQSNLNENNFLNNQIDFSVIVAYIIEQKKLFKSNRSQPMH